MSQPTSDEVVTVSIPYVQGDSEGQFTDALYRALAASGLYQVVQSEGQLRLCVAIISSGQDRIGFQYDRKDISGKLQKNLLQDETRRTIVAEATLIETATDQVVLGPTRVEASADFDYVNPDSLQELIFFDRNGVKQTTMSFSLGQLDSIEGAHDAATPLIYTLLAQKIADGLMNNR